LLVFFPADDCARVVLLPGALFAIFVLLFTRSLFTKKTSFDAFDWFLEQLARRARDRRGGEKGTFAKAPVAVERVRVKE
jgi:hypothetical protein